MRHKSYFGGAYFYDYPFGSFEPESTKRIICKYMILDNAAIMVYAEIKSMERRRRYDEKDSREDQTVEDVFSG